MARQEGATTRQILEAPTGAIYIWVNSWLHYPKALARDLGRPDIQFVAPHWLGSTKWVGMQISGIVVDHATLLTGDQWQALQDIQNHIRRTNGR